ncbi:probable CCR4-associated factor 1 homolog 11 [Herrania umbratica]|uniref:poly(A)-specific ribonuclease n=1 Tax=Herrania umbratica TaxID=108875 RepID=A0A6J1AI13_9ROSI|nr:probable CCR4-associated factor 1 homolog 11 [Herrania umbratica]
MTAPGKKPVLVRQVFAEDLEREFAIIRSAIDRYPFVSMDTEFPGTIFKQDKNLIHQADPAINYLFMKSNVDALRIIQLGLTLSDSQGNLPDFNTPYCYVWEFNFKDFDFERDCYDKESIKLLKMQGIDFVKNKKKGIDSKNFAKKILASGLVFSSLTWITFHGAYDFGFLMKILTQHELPYDVNSFMAQLVYFFGYKIYDIKHTFRFFGLHGGLEKVAKLLNVARLTGVSHQAGSDSLLTLQCLMELKQSKVFDRINYNRMLPALALYGLVTVLG